MQRTQGSLCCSKRELMSLLMIVLVLMLPVVDAQSQFLDVPGDQFARLGEEVVGSPYDGGIGEDIIINVDEYEPTPIPTQVIEDEGINVIAMLKGMPTNPSVEISSIRRVVTQPVAVRTIPPNMPVSLGAIRHIPPRPGEISYQDMGYVVVPLRRIP